MFLEGIERDQWHEISESDKLMEAKALHFGVNSCNIKVSKTTLFCNIRYE